MTQGRSNPLDRYLDAFFEPYVEAGEEIARRYGEQPVLDAGEIAELDTIADAQERYAGAGYDLAWEEARNQLKHDWWHLHRDRDGADGSGLPGEGRTVTIHAGDETYSADVTVHGVVHGFPEHIPMEDDLVDMLRAETRDFLEGGDAVYVEEGFGELFYEEWEDEYDRFTEMGDVTWMEEETGDTGWNAFGAVFQNVLKPLAGYQGKAMRALSTIPADYRPPGLDKAVTMIEALEDRDALADAHNSERAGQLPYRFKRDWLLQESREPQEIEGIGDMLGEEVESRLRAFVYQLTVGRSREMGEEVLEAVMDEEVDHVRMVVGLGHQYDILEYLGGLDPSDLPARE